MLKLSTPYPTAGPVDYSATTGIPRTAGALNFSNNHFSVMIKSLFAILGLVTAFAASAHAANPPAVGDNAPNFTLKTLEAESVELAKVLEVQPVVLVVLRGWPGYQCPLCTRQVQEFVRQAADFSEQGGRVLMVYPGPAEQLEVHAQEFLQNTGWPDGFSFVIDPDYAFTEAYRLRWDAKNETAYPSTFVIDRAGKVRFAHISRTHGDRVGARAALEALRGLK